MPAIPPASGKSARRLHGLTTRILQLSSAALYFTSLWLLLSKVSLAVMYTHLWSPLHRGGEQLLSTLVFF